MLPAPEFPAPSYADGSPPGIARGQEHLEVLLNGVLSDKKSAGSPRKRRSEVDVPEFHGPMPYPAPTQIPTPTPTPTATPEPKD